MNVESACVRTGGQFQYGGGHHLTPFALGQAATYYVSTRLLVGIPLTITISSYSANIPRVKLYNKTSHFDPANAPLCLPLVTSSDMLLSSATGESIAGLGISGFQSREEEQK
jgi:hypothetical protein